MKTTLTIALTALAVGTLIAIPTALAKKPQAQGMVGAFSYQQGPPAMFVALDQQPGGTDYRHGDAGFLPLANWTVKKAWMTFGGSYYPGYIPESFTGPEKNYPTGNSWDWHIRNDNIELPLYGTAVLKIVFINPSGQEVFCTKNSNPGFLTVPCGGATGDGHIDWDY